MIRLRWLLCCLLFTVYGQLWAAVSEGAVHHELQVSLDPAQQSLSATARITLPDGTANELLLWLHSGLDVRIHNPDGGTQLDRLDRDGRFARYRLRLAPGSREVELGYSGRVHDALESDAIEQARGIRNTSGLIDEDGTFLSAASLWYPQFDGLPRLTFELEIDLPAGWRAVSQGMREWRDESGERVRERWRETREQEEIYLVAAAFTEYREPVDNVSAEIEAQVFLRKPDPRLAAKYIEATGRYIRMYEKLLGPYPYGKFALVENFWETGFGMPSFTLLGTRVIRLPFILNSSYPHEILHNWWGNGVYVDFATGNWSEGLTAYLADHLIRQQQGQAVAYRQQTLQKYRDYAAVGRDFSLAEFRGRHSPATEAVGYGKTMMLFHMLRNHLGDEDFTSALRQFYTDYRFQPAGFSDLERVFSEIAGKSLDDLFNQWVERSGAPELGLSGARVEPTVAGFRLEFALEQRQDGPAYHLEVPLAITLESTEQARQQVVILEDRRQDFSLEFDRRPLRIDIDPQFDLFRKLAAAETPAAFTELFGARDMTVVLPRSAPPALREGWSGFARSLGHTGPGVEVLWDDQLDHLPRDRAVTVLGWNNRFADDMQRTLEREGVRFEDAAIRTGLTRTPRNDQAFAWVTRSDPDNLADAVPWAWITADLTAALPGLARKLPHYHKYSYLAFAGEEPANSLKGRWEIRDSPLSALLVADSPRARLVAQPALIEPESPFSQQRMLGDVRRLADPVLAGRGFAEAGLQQAGAYIADAMRAAGLQPAGDDGSYFQYFEATGGVDNRVARLRNIVGLIPGSNPKYDRQSLVVGAHYDHLGSGWPDVCSENRGQVHPGADDNASGVAVLLELARVLGKNFKPERSILFVAFSAEEAGRLGSRAYLRQMSRYPAKDTIAMLNLDSVGRLFDNRLLVLGAESAGAWPHIFRGIGFVTGIPSVIVSEPLDASDQVSFHEAGIPAVQLFTGAHTDYHRPGDSADKIDGAGLVKVAEVSRQAVEYLAMREERLDSRLQSGQAAQTSGPQRRVSLGTVPDFTHEGSGYRLDGVVAGSPAEHAGLQKADIIIAIEGQQIGGIRAMSKLLKSFQPEQAIRVTFLRDGERRETEAVLTAR